MHHKHNPKVGEIWMHNDTVRSSYWRIERVDATGDVYARKIDVNTHKVSGEILRLTLTTYDTREYKYWLIFSRKTGFYSSLKDIINECG